MSFPKSFFFRSLQDRLFVTVCAVNEFPVSTSTRLLQHPNSAKISSFASPTKILYRHTQFFQTGWHPEYTLDTSRTLYCPIQSVWTNYLVHSHIRNGIWNIFLPPAPNTMHRRNNLPYLFRKLSDIVRLHPGRI